MPTKEKELTPNLVMSVSALPKTGKNHFSCTAPSPIRFYCFNGGADYVASKFPDKKIEVKNFKLPIVEDTESIWAAPIWEQFSRQVKEDIKEGRFITYVLDTSTEVENVCQQSVLETAKEEAEDRGRDKKKLATNEFLARNLKMKAIYDQIKDSGANLIALQYLKEEWIKGAGDKSATATGKLVPDGWKRNESQCDINLEFTRKPPVTENGKKVVHVIATVVSSRYDDFNNSITGETLIDPTFDDVVALALGG